MTASDLCKEYIKSWEKCRLVAYDDGVGVMTIGWGHTKNVKAGMACTQENADAWFEEELPYYERFISLFVKVPLEQHQYDATTSIIYNVGPGAKGVRDGIIVLANGNPSTLLRKLNAGDYAGAAAQFDAWNRGGGKVMQGLVERRRTERQMFEKAVYEMHQ